jgi:hypothetical protein
MAAFGRLIATTTLLEMLSTLFVRTFTRQSAVL